MVAGSALEALYTQQIRPLPAEQRRRLLAMVEHDLQSGSADQPPVRSLLELEGLGSDLWHDIDAQAYVQTLRAEWDDRP